jgi:hypothetical protein
MKYFLKAKFPAVAQDGRGNAVQRVDHKERFADRDKMFEKCAELLAEGAASITIRPEQ